MAIIVITIGLQGVTGNHYHRLLDSSLVTKEQRQKGLSNTTDCHVNAEYMSHPESDMDRKFLYLCTHTGYNNLTEYRCIFFGGKFW